MVLSKKGKFAVDLYGKYVDHLEGVGTPLEMAVSIAGDTIHSLIVNENDDDLDVLDVNIYFALTQKLIERMADIFIELEAGSITMAQAMDKRDKAVSDTCSSADWLIRRATKTATETVV